MKVLGLTCGRRNSNTEILVKEALMGAQELGAEVEIVRLQDLNIKPCTGCNACVIDLFEKGGCGDCVIKNDDLKFIDEKLLDCDGLIVGSPLYEKSPTGQLKCLNDRMGPSHDLAFRMIAQHIREEKGITTGKGPDPRSFKPRVAALIAVGGSDWTELGLPMLQLFAMPMQFQVVDQQVYDWNALPAVITLMEDKLSRAREQGRNVAQALLGNRQEAKYVGPAGMCPACHTNLIEIKNASLNEAGCATCGIRGKLVTKGDKVTFVVTPEAMARSHMFLSGKFSHGDDLNKISLHPLPNMSEIPGRLKKYKDYLVASKPEHK
jgi:multimeric flavodoxin WrbA